jgi:hypothetical protein
MKPYKSSSDKENCSPVSSNCVIWQGPDISCINICKGDSISDITYKLATQLCELQNTTSLDDLQLDCILNICTNSPEPELTLAAVLQLIIDKICCSFGTLNTAIDNIITEGFGGSSDEPILNLPPCLQYTDPSTGLLVTSLVMSSYVVHLANEFCLLKATVTTHTAQITSLDTRVTDLEDAPCCYIPPLVTSNCSYGNIVAGIPTAMNVLLDNLDDQYCQLRDVLGTNNQLTSATASQCTNLGSLTALSQPGTMSSLAGWNNTINSFAQSMQNLWITVCDMRGVIDDLRDCCGASDCSSFFLGFTVGTTTSTNIFLLFNSLTVIPPGYSNCPTLSSVTINDGNGHLYTSTFDLVAASTNPSGVDFDISASGLDVSLPWTIVVTGCIVNTAGTCTKIVTNTIPAPIPVTTTTTTVAPCNNYNVYIEAADITDAAGNTNSAQDGNVYLSYIPCGDTVSVTTIYSTSGAQSAICIDPIYAPYFFYFNADVLITGTSYVTLVGTCTPPL